MKAGLSFWKGSINLDLYDLIFKPNIAFLRQDGFILRNFLYYLSPWYSLSEQINNDVYKKTRKPSFYNVESVFSNSIYMITLGAIYRLTSLFAANINLIVDKLEISNFSKYLARLALGTLPSLVLCILGMPVYELAIAEVLKFTLGSIANFFSTRIANTVREIDLLSSTKESNLTYATQRSFISSLINYSGTLLLDWLFHKNTLTNNIFNARIANIGIYEINGYVSVISQSQITANRLVYHLNEVNWFIGSSLVNIGFGLLSKLGVVKDMRRPFGSLIETPPSDETPVLLNRKQRKSMAGKLKKSQQLYSEIEEQEDKKTSIKTALLPETSITATSHNSPSSSREISENLSQREGPKIKSRPALPQPREIGAQAIPAAAPYELETNIHGIRFLRLSGQGITNNTWAIVDEALTDSKIFERAILAGRVGPNSNIERINATQFSVRPNSTGERAIGSLRTTNQILDTLNTIFGNRLNLGLAQLMDIQDNLVRQDPAPLNIVYFDTQARNHDYNRALRVNASRANNVGVAF